jgi:two-component sensor histidine kinase
MTLAVILSATALGCYIILGITVIRHNIRTAMNRAFLLYLTAMLFWQLTALMVSVSTEASNALLFYRLMTAGLGGQFIFFLFFTLIFLGEGRQRIFFNIGWLVYMALLVTGGTDLVIKSVSMSETTGLFVPEFGILVPIVGINAFAFLGYGIFSLARGYRQSKSNLHRNRILYFLLGAGTIGIGAFSNIIPALQHYPVDVAVNVLGAFLFTYAILRFQLLDIGVVFRKGLLYSVPTIIIGSSYFLIISLALNIFHAYTGAQIFVLSLIVAIITALIAQPLRDRAQSWIDRFFFREKYDSGLMLQRLSGVSASILDLDKLGALILDEISTAMHIETVAIFLKNAGTGSFHIMAHKGLSEPQKLSFRENHPIILWLIKHQRALTQTNIDLFPQFKSLWADEKADLQKINAELMIPLTAKNDLVGVFALGPKRSEQPYSLDDQLTLITLANQTAMTIENARLYWELQKTNEALLEAHDILETRVVERTAELGETNQALEEEIVERKRVQEKMEAALDEKEVLLKEIHHRVKNNLQIISSLLSLQSRKIEDPTSLQMFQESQDRVRSMALIHAKLYESQDLASIDFPNYIRSLTKFLFESHMQYPGQIDMEITSGEIYLDIDKAVPLGLIINELVTNSLKHAFPANHTGKIAIRMLSNPEQQCIQLVVEDDGIGVPDNFDYRNTDTLGLKLVNTLVGQLNGSIKLNSRQGTTFKINIEK